MHDWLPFIIHRMYADRKFIQNVILIQLNVDFLLINLKKYHIMCKLTGFVQKYLINPNKF